MIRNAPKFFALLPVRDEGDIIRQCLLHALGWADAIYVYDTGSVDDTYDIVQDMARQDNRIHPVGCEPVYYNENRVRGHIFAEARHAMRDGDWFLRVDADEFHHTSPRDFVETERAAYEGVVYHQYYNFELTASEVAKWELGEETIADRSRPISDRRRNFTVSTYAEPRMCRYRSSMRWPVEVSFPFNAGLVARERLPIRHYPLRDPKQIDRRCKLREIMMADSVNRSNWSHPEAHHWNVRDWKAFVSPDDLDGLQNWAPGDQLPRVRQTNHIANGLKRKAQMAAYALGLPALLDGTRKGWNDSARPLPIGRETQDLLCRELAL